MEELHYGITHQQDYTFSSCLSRSLQSQRSNLSMSFYSVLFEMKECSSQTMPGSHSAFFPNSTTLLFLSAIAEEASQSGTNTRTWSAAILRNEFLQWRAHRGVLSSGDGERCKTVWLVFLFADIVDVIYLVQCPQIVSSCSGQQRSK